MEFHGSRKLGSMEKYQWGSMELWIWTKFHGIPWNHRLCSNIVQKFTVRKFQWHEQFHGIRWNSLELGVREFRWHEQFRGIPWNSMELGVCEFRWHEKFHGTPWNSMELWLSQFRGHDQIHGFPWNFMQLGIRQFRWHDKFHRISWKCNHIIQNSTYVICLQSIEEYIINGLQYVEITTPSKVDDCWQDTLHCNPFKALIGIHSYDDVIKWKYFLPYWPFVRGIHRSTVNSPHKGQWGGALMLSLICTWINAWLNNGEAGDLRRRHDFFFHYNIWGCMCSTGPFQYRWLKGYIYSPCHYHHHLGSIHFSRCYHIFPWLCAWDVCYTMFCYLLHIHSGKTRNLFSLLLCSFWWVRIIRCILDLRSYSFICTLHHLIITIVPNHLKTLNM